MIQDQEILLTFLKEHNHKKLFKLKNNLYLRIINHNKIRTGHLLNLKRVMYV